MTKQVVWTKYILDTFLEESGINERVKFGDEKAILMQKIMKTRYANWTITKQSMEFNVSKDTINNYIKELKQLYDETQKSSKTLPKRLKVKSIIEDMNLNK